MNPAERTELARLLPSPHVSELPADRRELLKGAYMQYLTEVTAKPVIRPARRRRRLLFTAAVTAAVLAAVLAGTLVVGRYGTADSPRISAPIVAVQPGDPSGVAPLMEKVALNVGRKPAVVVGPDQYAYVRSKGAWLVFPEGDDGPQEAGADVQVLDVVQEKEVWHPQTAGRDGLIRKRGETFASVGAPVNSVYTSLPTDPDQLLRKIYADTKGVGPDPDYEAFDFIGTALTSYVVPPAVSAALYRAAAKIPGVVLVNDSVDAIGRHGIAIARTDRFGERREWIFDPATLDFLGERSYLVRDTETGKAGMLTGTNAILERGVVDTPGSAPR